MPEMLDHYSRALDEIYRLRLALAYEASVLEVGLDGYATIAKGMRERLERAAERMKAAARGSEGLTHLADLRTPDAVLRSVGASSTLTRAQWEAAAPASSGSDAKGDQQ